tara:strand:- start:98 stop:925 length:828 start_codon:yes stop_codon:yes gene_type:complete
MFNTVIPRGWYFISYLKKLNRKKQIEFSYFGGRLTLITKTLKASLNYLVDNTIIRNHSLPTLLYKDMIFVYYSEHGNPSTKEEELSLINKLISIQHFDHRTTSTYCTKVPTSLFNLSENIVDSAHFPIVHSHLSSLEIEDFITEPYSFVLKIKLITSRILLFISPMSLDIKFTSMSIGTGFFAVYSRMIEWECITFLTPINHSTTQIVLYGNLHKMFFFPKFLNPLFNIFFVTTFGRTILQDINIWKKREITHQPVLSTADGPIMKFRNWYSKFI